MRKPALFVLLLTLVFATTSASAQSDRTPRGGFVLADPSYSMLDRFPEYRECSYGNITGCYLLQYGDCADDNPRVAIPSCTRGLAVQDNRRHGVNVRFERAVRYLLRANAHTIQGNLERALSDYDRAVKAHSGVFWIHAVRGDAYFLSGIYDEALESYNRALALEPDEASALSNRALVLAAAPDGELHDAPQALADAQHANEVLPGQPTYIDALAIAYAANGDFDMAAAEEQRAINLLSPDDQSTRDTYRERLNIFRNNMAFRMTAKSES